MKLEMWQKFPGMEELVLRFLAPGLWEKHKSELARKVTLGALGCSASSFSVSTAIELFLVPASVPRLV